MAVINMVWVSWGAMFSYQVSFKSANSLFSGTRLNGQGAYEKFALVIKTMIPVLMKVAQNTDIII